MEFSLENTDMQHLKESDGNVGHGLEMFLKQNGQVKSSNQPQGGKAVNTSGAAIGANTISRANGILNEQGLHDVSGWGKPFKGTALKAAVEQLNLFHEAMDKEVSRTNIGAMEQANNIFSALIREVKRFTEEGSWFHKKEQAALRPVMSTLLIQLYSLGNVFDNRENLAYDYLMEHNLEKVRLGDIITGRGAMSVQGNMVSTGIESGQIDRTAQQLNKREYNVPQRNYLQELNERRLPSLGDKNAAEELKRIAIMLEDAELRAADSVVLINDEDKHRENERERVRTQFFDVTKMIHILLQNPALLHVDGAVKLPQGMNSHEANDFSLTLEYYKATAGMTVQEATEKLDKIRQGKAETAAQDSISKSGALSEVLIDVKQGRVLRTSLDPQEKKGIKEQKNTNNFNYDEAMSRLGEVTGLGGQAGARATYYKNTKGKLQYGTNMDLAKGKAAKETKLSFGDAQVDSQMKAGRYNIFGTGENEINKNAGLIISSFKLQIIDYLSLHSDRHDDNFFIDLDAEDPTQAFMGIDNDNVFGHAPSMTNISYQQHANEAAEKNDTKKYGYRDLTTLLKGFKYIPKETAKQIADLDEEKINEAMKPYLDRAARFGLMKRIKKLKEYVPKEAKVIDIYDPGGMEEFRKGTMKLLAKAYIEQADTSLLGISQYVSGIRARMMPGILLRALAGQYFGFGNVMNAEKQKRPELEYITDGTSVKDYFSEKNKKTREEKLWKTFQGIIRAAEMEEDEEYKSIKEKYETGKLEIFT